MGESMLSESIVKPTKDIRNLWSEIGVVVLFLVICHVAVANSTVRRIEQWAKPVKPEINLYQVDQSLFRSKQLSKEDYETLEHLHIKSIVNLRFFDRDEDAEVFEGKPIEITNVPLITWNIKARDVAKALWEIEKDQKKGNVLVHCYHGADRTGVVVAMYRVIYQGWTMEEAKQELIEGPYGFHKIWINIENFFTPENEAIVREELEQLRTTKN